MREGRPPPAEPDMEPICFKRKLMGRASRGGGGDGEGACRAGREGGGSQPFPFRADFIETQHYGERLRVWAVGDPAPGRGEGSVDMGHCLMLRSWRRCDVL